MDRAVGPDELERRLSQLPALGVDDLELPAVGSLKVGAATFDRVHRQDAAVVRLDGTRLAGEARARTCNRARNRTGWWHARRRRPASTRRARRGQQDESQGEQVER